MNKEKPAFTAVSARRRKILIATGIYPPDIGGPATILKSLMNSLLESDFDVRLITYSNIDKSSDDSDKIFRVNRNGFLNQFRYLLKMIVLAKWADAVYVTDTYSVGYFAYLIKKIFNKKYLVRFVGDSAWETAVGNNWTTDYIVDFQNKKYNSKIEKLKSRRRKILTNANMIITVSNFMAGVAKQIGVKEDKIKIIYNSIDFIDESINKNEVEAIRNEFAGTKIISTACRLTPWKGVDGIIKILPDLNDKIGNLVLLVLGDGPELENLKRLADELGVGQKVKFLGKIEHQKVANYFKVSDLFILNTNYEAMSHTLLEAMTAGVPIVTTTAGGNPEVIENNQDGLLVEYNNQEQLLAAATKILSDKNLADQLVKNAGEKLKIFNWNNIIKETAKILTEL